MSVLPFLAGLGSTAFAADVVVFGDSWAEGAADELADTFVARGRSDITVSGHGVGGTTAEHWAVDEPTALHEAVTANPDARWVWLSIGGNDLFAHYMAGDGANAASDNDTNIRKMLDDLWAVHPDIKVVMFGYDFTNFEQSTECIALAYTYFGPVITHDVNGYFYSDVRDVQKAIADDQPLVTYVDLWGTLQAADGITTAPDPWLPSPKKYMSDCIHANHEGYLLVHGALYDGYWGLPEPTAVISGDTEVCEGDEVVLADVGSGAERRAWKIDGADAGNGSSVEIDNSTVGTRTVELRVDAGAWDATDMVTVTVVAGDSAPCNGGGDDSGDSDDTGGSDDTGPESQDSGDTDVGTGDAAACGCASGSPGGSWLLPLLGALWRRRRGA